MRVWKWVLVIATVGLLGLTTVLVLLLRPSHVKSIAIAKLAEHLNLETSIDEVWVSFAPRPRVSGRNLVLRLPNRPDLPPFISIDTFWMEVGLLSIIRDHVSTVHASGLKIVVPPRDDLQGAMGSAEAGKGGTPFSEIIIDHFITEDAVLTFVAKKAGRIPLAFRIQKLAIDRVGFGNPMPFTATLTNPVPEGRVEATGTIGPWLREDATRTPLAGAYTFTDAKLSTINGIGGTLKSTGRFAGVLTEIEAIGEATVPDFSLDLGGKPMPLSADFDTMIDGTDGTTVLKRVNATLGQTKMVVTGAIANLAGPGRHDVNLSVHVEDGRIEDLLALVIDAPRPVMVGDVAFDARLSLPPGPSRVRDRLRLSGRFGLARTRFTSRDVQQKLQDLSRRSQGLSEEEAIGRVLTDLKGQFSLASGVATLTSLLFRVPGATVSIRGTYGLADGVLDFHGTLAMQATVSKAMGGFKSIFLKPFDPLFRRKGAGAMLPIKITGPRQAPKFGLEIGRVLKRE